MSVPLKSLPLSLRQRMNFASKYAEGAPDECWIWQAGKDGNGYPRFSVGSGKEPEIYGPRKIEYGHRIAWALAHDHMLPARPYGVSQTCGRRDCLNPAHLTLSRPGRPAADEEYPLAFLILTPKQRSNFMAKYAEGTPDACWIWQAGKDGNGYPRFSVGSQQNQEVYGSRKIEYGHRIAWALAHGDTLPAKPWGVNHMCLRRDCVNPAHLQVSKPGRVGA